MTEWTTRRRAALVETLADLSRRLDDLEWQEYTAEVAHRRRTLDASRVNLRDEYNSGLPVRAISRCPFTGAVVNHSIDDFDLDGPWWDYHATVRPIEHLPATFFAMTGAVKLGGEPTSAPFLCKPGPEVPYVIPRMLEHEAVKAVVSSLRIGQHRGFAIVYFAEPIPYDLARANEWGGNEYWFTDAAGRRVWREEPERESDMDFALRPWIEAGRLLWIPPDDASLELRSDVEECPYIDLDGSREATRIQDGKVWRPSDLS
jgi:hypothetical protein